MGRGWGAVWSVIDELKATNHACYHFGVLAGQTLVSASAGEQLGLKMAGEAASGGRGQPVSSHRWLSCHISIRE